jgi:hypothetical protein
MNFNEGIEFFRDLKEQGISIKYCPLSEHSQAKFHLYAANHQEIDAPQMVEAIEAITGFSLVETDYKLTTSSALESTWLEIHASPASEAGFQKLKMLKNLTEKLKDNNVEIGKVINATGPKGEGVVLANELLEYLKSNPLKLSLRNTVKGYELSFKHPNWAPDGLSESDQTNYHVDSILALIKNFIADPHPRFQNGGVGINCDEATGTISLVYATNEAKDPSKEYGDFIKVFAGHIKNKGINFDGAVICPSIGSIN